MKSVILVCAVAAALGLTYTLVRHLGTTTSRWNATQVYQRKKEGWRIVHSHWSATRPAEL
jgi:hypothetical protein